MPYLHRAALAAVLPAAAAIAAVPASAAAQAAPIPTASDVALAGGAALQAPSALPALPASGLMVRVLGRQLRLASGRTVAVRARTTTLPIHAELRVGKFGRVVDAIDAPANTQFRLQGSARSGERLWLRVRRTDGGSERAWVSIGGVSRMRQALASWYGPGLYGQRTACGQTLTTALKGVAHRSLPCGTTVTVRYRGRSTLAQVVDRGPFSGSREFDLTGATARAIGFSAVGRVWVAHR
jgi:rare lipoprotein A